MMHDRGKSDSAVVPAKRPNKAEEPAAEGVEGRALAKGNSPERTALRTQSREGASSALERVRQAARKDKKQRFTALLHHVYAIARLRAAYCALQRDAADHDSYCDSCLGRIGGASLRSAHPLEDASGIPVIQ